jgi:aminoglycoside phosphotransferase (APT) family kinase protein
VDRAAITQSLVSRLIADQFPHWAHLPVCPVEFDGWDNRTFRLGDEMSVRLPVADEYIPQIDKEHRWLPLLAVHLPVAIPVPLAKGAPACGFPRPWSVCRWLTGMPAHVADIDRLDRFAVDLAEFLWALQRIDPDRGPSPGEHNFFRGAPLAVYDGETTTAIQALGGQVDVRTARDVWDAALASRWQSDPVWIHGDVTASNLLVVAGRLGGVIDFGCCAVGDPACDLTIAWTFLCGKSRAAFRDAIAVDDGTWARSRGWALWKGLITLTRRQREPDQSGSPETRLGWRRTARQVIDDVLEEHRGHV